MSMEQAERDDRVMGLVAEAMAAPLRERDSFLQARCHNDPDLYREVSEIITWEERMGSFMRRPLIEFVDLEALEQVFEPRQTVAGRFEIIRRVGDGGMGIVYEAFDNTRIQRIAIKCPKPGYDDLLPRELKGALDVRHPNVCLVNDIHTTKTDLGEVRFLTMEFLDGETLAQRLDGGKLDEAEARPIARQLSDGLAAAHRSSILHRDLKPGNVILSRENGETRAVITDFGLATESSNVSDHEGGTLNYMAPELWRGGTASQASDVFSLGVILYEMVTGCKPFPALNTQNVAFPPPVAPSKLVRNLPRRWDAAIMPCLKETPDERPSAKDVLAALNHTPFYRKPAVLTAIAACLVLALSLALPPLVALLTPAPTRLAILPVEGPSDMAQESRAIVDNMAGSIRSMQPGNAVVSVIPLSKTVRNNVTTPEQARKNLGATHALQLKLLPDGRGGVDAEGAIINLETGGHVRDYSAHFSQSDLADLTTGLTGTVALALKVPHVAAEETVAPAAAAAYKRGRSAVEGDPIDFASAISAFQQAAQLDPHSPLPPAGMAEAHAREFQATHRLEAMDEAKNWLAKAETLNADSIQVRMTSGLIYLLQSKPVNALEDYKRAQAIAPNNADALVGLGFSYESQNMLNEAMAYYRRAIAASPDYYKPYEFFGGLYYYQGRYREAEEFYKKFTELAPDRSEAYGCLAGVYTAEFKDAEAEALYRKALQLYETPLTLNNIGARLAYQGRDREAIFYYKRATKLDPYSYVYLLNLGDSQRRIKDVSGSRASYQSALRIATSAVIANPGSSSHRAYLAYLEARLGLKAQARSDIAAALNLPGKDNQVILTAVETYVALDDSSTALSTAAPATAQTLKEIDHHPDLAGLQQNSRFRLLLAHSN